MDELAKPGNFLSDTDYICISDNVRCTAPYRPLLYAVLR